MAMSAQPTPTGSPESILTEDSRMLIQRTMEDWCGNFGQRLSGDSISILASGINQILVLVEACVRPAFINSMVMDSLSWGDGDVDLVQYASELTKRMVQDVISELKGNIKSY